jgi:hypothetical protein
MSLDITMRLIAARQGEAGRPVDLELYAAELVLVRNQVIDEIVTEGSVSAIDGLVDALATVAFVACWELGLAKGETARDIAERIASQIEGLSVE